MPKRIIDADELYRVEGLLRTDIIESDPVALNLLEQVLFDIEHLPALTYPNDPLTLDELYQMDGQPVWCEYIGDTTFASRWLIVDCEMEKCSSGKWELPFEDNPDDGYGRTWIAYRYPPEGERS